MLIFAATAAAAFSGGVPMQDFNSVKTIAPVCERAGKYPADKYDGRALPETPKPLVGTLGDQPAADLYSAVLYTQGQCSQPIVIGRNIGNLTGGLSKEGRKAQRFK